MASANGRFVAKVGCAPWIVRPLLRTSGFDPSPERSMQLLRYAIHRAAMGDCRATSEAGRRRSEQWRSWALVGHEAEAYRAAGCAPDVRYRISTLFPLTPRLLKVLGANERPSDAAGINESGSRWIVAFCQSCHHTNRSPPPCVNFMNVPLSAGRQGRPCIRPAPFSPDRKGPLSSQCRSGLPGRFCACSNRRRAALSGSAKVRSVVYFMMLPVSGKFSVRFFSLLKWTFPIFEAVFGAPPPMHRLFA